MNDSTAETNPPHRLTDPGDLDALYDRFETLLYRLVKLLGQHSGSGDDLLPVPHYMMLRTLEQMGPMRISDIANHLGAKNPAVSMLLHVLDDEGWVERAPDPTDRRATFVSLSKSGEGRIQLAEEQRHHFMRNVTSKLTAKQLNDLILGLDAVADSVAEMHENEDGQTSEGT